MDETGSLNQMDPDNARQGAILEVLEGLAELAATTAPDGGAVTVLASMGLFATNYREIVGWGDVAGPHLTQLQNATRQYVVNPARGPETNHATGLAGAQAAINAEAAEVGAQACSVVFWFTDGKLDVGPSNDAATAAAERAALGANFQPEWGLRRT